jgi:NADH-quinone oxidoreductase subunit N
MFNLPSEFIKQSDLLIKDIPAFLPELILCAGVVLLLLMRLFPSLNRLHLGWFSLFVTVAALGVSVCQWDGFYNFQKPEDNPRWREMDTQRSFPDRRGDVEKSRENIAQLSQAVAKARAALESAKAQSSAPAKIAELRQHFDTEQEKLQSAEEKMVATEATLNQMSGNDQAFPIFGRLLVFDRLALFTRLFLLTFTALIIWLTLLTGIPDSEDSADFHCLLLGSVVGMSLMASANHLLMMYIGVEMASLPSYALAGFLKGRRQSSEAALKYVVYGGGAAGVMLYGISLLAGKFGTGYLPDLAAAYVSTVHLTGGGWALDPVLVMGTFFVLIGIAFKLAAVPFHFWCPDVFEGASAEVAGFLSVASKGAALAMLARVILVLGGFDPLVGVVEHADWSSIIRYLVPALAFFAALTTTFGNLAAYLQTNLKRLLAYSTIAHAGYMMMGLATMNQQGVAAVLFYLMAYLLMNLGAFAIVAFLRNQTGSEDLNSFRGLVRRSPWMVVLLSVFLLSLLGIPPLAGFIGKFMIFRALWDTGQGYYAAGEAGLGATMFGLLVIGGLNTVFSAVYYLKVMKVMILESRVEDIEGQEPQPLPEPLPNILFAGVIALAVIVFMGAFDPLGTASNRGVERFSKPAAASQPNPLAQVSEVTKDTK